MGAAYSFVSRWRVPAPRERCWAELERVMGTGGDVRWWRGVSIPRPPRRLAEGEGFTLAVRSPLGYRLTAALELVTVEGPRELEASAVGDLRGRGRVVVQADGPQASVLRFEWDVATERAWMNATAPILRPVFARAHAAVMRAGERGLRAALTTGR